MAIKSYILWRNERKTLETSSPRFLKIIRYLRQRGRVVSAPDSQSSGPGFESHPDSSPEFKSSAVLVNSQLVCFQSVGILDNVMLNLNYLFQLFARPH